MKIRIATFNCENLFARYKFREGRETLAPNGFTINDLAFDIYDETSKQLTAKAIKEVNADIICLQEIESLPVLERFNSRFLGGMKYKYRMLIDSHDPRYIDVAILSRYPFGRIKTYRHERNKNNTWWLFSRDCLETDVDIQGETLTVYVNHFKSMIGGRDGTMVNSNCLKICFLLRTKHTLSTSITKEKWSISENPYQMINENYFSSNRLRPQGHHIEFARRHCPTPGFTGMVCCVILL